MSEVHVPAHVRTTVEDSGRLVLLNSETGHLHALNRPGEVLWQELTRHGDVERAITALVRCHPAVPPDRVRGDAEQLITGLTTRGLLEPGAPAAAADRRPPGRTATGRPESPHRRDAGRPSRADRISTVIAFPLALFLRRLPFGTAMRLLSVRRYWVTRSATPAEAHATMAASALAARRYLGRAACLELSMTAVLAASLRRRAVDWCLGTATDPRRFHAWVEVDGEPIELPGYEPASHYTRMLIV
jgi:hypothetical protein